MTLIKDLLQLNEAKRSGDEIIAALSASAGIGKGAAKAIFIGGGDNIAKSVLAKLEKDGFDTAGGWTENQKWFKKHGVSKSDFNVLSKLSESVQLDEAYFEDDNIEVTDEVNDFCDKNEIKITKDGKYGLVKFKGAINKLKKLIQQFTKDPEDYYGAIVESASLTEAKYSNGSADFENDAADLHKHLREAIKILKKSEWQDWMNSTDENFTSRNGGALAKSEKLLEKLKDSIKDFDALYDHIVDAE